MTLINEKKDTSNGMKNKKRMIVFASGTETGGGSGLRKSIEHERSGKSNSVIVGVVSNHEFGGVRKITDEFGIPFEYFPGPFKKENNFQRGYEAIIKKYNPDFIMLSGWIKMAKGLSPKITVNIHPGLLPNYGGKGMWGHHVHEKVIEDFKNGLITHTGLTMHFVTEEYDKGPKIFEFKVEILPDDTAETIGQRVNKFEHMFQKLITDLVVTGEISWDGKDPATLKIPHDKIAEILKLAA